MYAFLPREAVTRFLMSCKDCQKRMHLQIGSFSKLSSSTSKSLPASSSANQTNKTFSSNKFKDLLESSSLDPTILTSFATNLNPLVNNQINSKLPIKPTPKNSNKSTNKELQFNLPISGAYLKQINRLTKTGSIFGDKKIKTTDLNSLLCNNFNYLTGGQFENLSTIDLNEQETDSMISLDGEDYVENDEVDKANKSRTIDQTNELGNLSSNNQLNNEEKKRKLDFDCAELNDGKRLKVEFEEDRENSREIKRETEESKLKLFVFIKFY